MSNLNRQQQIDPAVEEVLASIRQIMAIDGESTEENAQSDIISFPRGKNNSRKPLDENSDILTLTEFAEAEELDSTPSQKEVVMAAKNEKQKNATSAKKTAGEGTDSTDEEAPLDLDQDAPAEDEAELKPENIEAPALTEDDLADTKIVSADDIESLMSPEAVAQSAAAFNDLDKLTSEVTQKMRTDNLGNQTVDELMRELLKPLLKEWLDSHLPSLVKWLVAEKIEQMIREKENNTKAS